MSLKHPQVTSFIVVTFKQNYINYLMLPK